MSTDDRALCVELIEAVLADDSRLDILDIARRARAALAEPEPEVAGPTDNDLLACMIEAARSVPDGQAIGIADWDQEAIAAARAVLARWGHQPAPPAAGEVEQAALVRRMCEIILGNTFGNEELDSLALLVGHRPDVLNASTVPASAPLPVAAGEVEELVALLRYEAREADLDLMTAEQCHRAADLLSQSHPAPVPVAERLPGPEDCDAEGRCWVGYPEWTYCIADTGDTDATTPEWSFERPPLKPKGSRCWWLPASALPLPAGEVE